MVWIGGGAPQGGRSRQTSYYRHRCHPTSRGGPGSRVYFDSHLTMKAHVARVARTCFYHLRRLRSIRRSLGRDVTARLVSALVISRLDYCNSVLAHLPASTLAPLQRDINAAVRMVVDLGPRNHVTPALYELHWLPIAERIKFKLCLLVHHSINGRAAIFYRVGIFHSPSPYLCEMTPNHSHFYAHDESELI